MIVIYTHVTTTKKLLMLTHSLNIVNCNGEEGIFKQVGPARIIWHKTQTEDWFDPIKEVGTIKCDSAGLIMDFTMQFSNYYKANLKIREGIPAQIENIGSLN